MSDDYPELWKRGLIQKRVRELANHHCEECGMEFQNGTNLAKSEVNRKGNPIIGTVHHIDEDKQNCSLNNLVYLCQKCHWTLHLRGFVPGKALLKKWNGIAPRWIVKRNVPYTKQYELPGFRE